MTPPATVGAWSLADPRWLVGLGLAVPLVLLHLHHRRRVVVPFLPLLVEAAGPRRAGGGWRRLRERLICLPTIRRLQVL